MGHTATTPGTPPTDTSRGPQPSLEQLDRAARDWHRGLEKLSAQRPRQRLDGVRLIERAVRNDPSRETHAHTVLTVFAQEHRRRWWLSEEAVAAARRVAAGGSAAPGAWHLPRDFSTSDWLFVLGAAVVAVLVAARVTAVLIAAI